MKDSKLAQMLVEITESDEPEIINDAAFALNCTINKKPTKDDQQKINNIAKFPIGECYDPYYFCALVQKELGMDFDSLSTLSKEKEKGPKKKRTAYNFFVSEMKRHGNGKSAKDIALEWNGLENDEKSYYEKLASQDKIRYNKEMLSADIDENSQKPLR
jgi:hypothetical protein